MTSAAAVEDLFLAALDRPNADRAAFLEAACAGDPDRLHRVRELLAAHDQTHGPLDAPPVAGPTADLPTTADSLGTAIGPYKLVEVIGEGGMGTVYLAQQQEPVKRLVALKVIRAGMDTAQVVARFAAERQALALMDHPNIAKVLDAGATTEGRPYFVMELVKGVPITRYCDDHHLTPRERLELFVPVCQAVQHAHQKGIIHRDLKPSNVLVGPYDGRPVPKVIDFGVAKAAGQALTEQTLVTGLGAVVGTLEYMSPEQAELNNLDVDTRSDVYSLGVLLYELLTGTTPLSGGRLKRAALLEALRLVREEEPPTPSRRLSDSGEALASISARRHTEPARLTRLVRGELDWIAMKALEKDRNRRYETANGLAMDVQRYLADEAVQACPPTARYKLRKFLRRNKRPVMAAALVLLALMGGILATTWQAVRANRERTIATQERDDKDNALTAETQARKLAMAALNSLTHDVVERLLGRQVALSAADRAFLQKIAAQYEAFAALRGEGEEARAMRALGHSKVGTLRLKLGERAEAWASFQKAGELYRQLAADFPAAFAHRAGLAACQSDLAGLFAAEGNHLEAEARYRDALAIQQQLVAEFPTEAAIRESMALVHLNRGNLHWTMGQHTEAEAEYRAAVAVTTQLAAEFPKDPDYREQLAMGHNNLANVLKTLSRRAEAEPEYRAALALQHRLVEQFPDVPGHRQEKARSHFNLGVLLLQSGKGPAAEAELRNAVVLQKNLAGEFPTVPAYRQELAMSQNSLGLLLDLQKKVGAETEFRDALALQKKLVADSPKVPAYRLDLAHSHNSLATHFHDRAKRSEAETEYRAALDQYKALVAEFDAVPEYAVGLGGGCCNFGAFLRDGGQRTEALEWYRRAIEALSAVHRRDPRLHVARQFLRNSHWGRAETLMQLQRFADATADWDRAIELDDGPKHAEFRTHRAIALAQAGQHAKAAAEADALAGAKDAGAATLYDLACVYALSAAAARADDKQAEQYAGRAVELLRRAVARGYKDAEHMKKDSDLDPLRSREDFKKLLAEMETKRKP